MLTTIDIPSFVRICRKLSDLTSDGNLATIYQNIFGNQEPPVFVPGSRCVAEMTLNPNFRNQLIAVMPFALTMFSRKELEANKSFEFYLESILARRGGPLDGCAPDVWLFKIDGAAAMTPQQIATALVNQVQAAMKLLREAREPFDRYVPSFDS